MLEIDRMLTLSTAHITPTTAKAIDAYLEAMKTQCHVDIEPNFDGLTIYPKSDYGWFIYIGNIDLDLPEDLKPVLNRAASNDCNWLCLDRDGDVVDDLVSYDW